MRARPALLVVTLWLSAATLPAAAEDFYTITPLGVVGYGGDTRRTRPGFGLSAALLGDRAFGFEVEAVSIPAFFGDEDGLGDNSLTSIACNLVVSGPVAGARPYASGGLTLLVSQVEGPGGLFGIDRNDAGLDLGAGLYAFFSPRLGARADVRYFRNLAAEERDTSPGGLVFGSTEFWRASLGITVKF